MRGPLTDRFWSKVLVLGGGGCWLWDGCLDWDGYGRLYVAPGDASVKETDMAHRVAYELLVGPIPDGMQLDHLCRVRDCVRPDHLEPVTQAENLRRGFIARGHTGPQRQSSATNKRNWERRKAVLAARAAETDAYFRRSAS